MPRVKIAKEKRATCHLMVTNDQHKWIFRQAISEQRPITHILEDMKNLYVKAQQGSAETGSEALG